MLFRSLDPIACGGTLILIGFFFAERFWLSGVSSVAELFRNAYGPQSERLSCAIQVPSFFLWIGSQFLAMGQLLSASLNLPLPATIFLSACITAILVVWGGMWAVTWANAIMIVISASSVLALFAATTHGVGEGDILLGWSRVLESTPEGFLAIDASTPTKSFAILGILLCGLLGNVPGQDIQQRVVAAKNASTAKSMCIIAGILYLLFGLIPLYLGLAARHEFGDTLDDSELPLNKIAALFLSEPLQILLILGMFCLCLSVAAGATISQATLLSNSVSHAAPNSPNRARRSVWIVIAGSLAVAYWGKSIMELLELSLVIVLVSLFAPMAFALLQPKQHQRPTLGWTAMCLGSAVWLIVYTLGDSFMLPASILGLSASFLAAFLSNRFADRESKQSEFD